ncbi:MAG: site-specific integrase [Sedimenticola sp.]
MLTCYYASPQYIEKLRNSPDGSHIEGFSQELEAAGYAQLTARRHIRAAAHLLHWAARKRITPEALQEADIDRFKRHLPRCQCYPYGHSDRRGLVSGAQLFLGYLQHVGVVPVHPAGDNKPIPPLLEAFRQWMKAQRGTSEATLYNYGLAIQALLRSLGEDPSDFDARGLREFILEQSRHCGWAKTRTMVTAVRAFIRFLIADGKCTVGHDEAILAPAHWRLSTLPRYLPVEEVERVIGACDPNTPLGIRDRAIVLLLARLGVRAGDIVSLRLDDIDWEEAWVRVSGKGRRESRLPLSQEVGDAIAAYLTEVRPKVETNRLFLRSRAPLRGFGSHCAVSVIVAKAMRQAGVTPATRGAAHLLRHSAATTWLQQGASLQEIAILLRHRSIETTTIYAKVDVGRLKQVAQPWPEVEPC